MKRPQRDPKPRRTRIDPLPYAYAWDGAMLDAAMARSGVTVATLAERTGYPERTLRYWLANRTEPGGSRALLVADAIGCPIGDFYRRVDSA